MVLSFSEGKGGGFFFWSIDRRFMVKTLEPFEFQKLRALLPKYYRHMWQHRRSLLPRFYGTRCRANLEPMPDPDPDPDPDLMLGVAAGDWVV